MANIKSQIKRNKTNEKSRVSNQSFRSAMKTEMKKIEATIVAGDKDAAKTALPLAISKIDKAAAKGIVTKSFAARQKSRLANKVNAI